MNRTLYFGEGLFETIRWRSSQKRLKLHYERLKNSAEFFHIPYPSFEEFLTILERTVDPVDGLYVKFCLLSHGGDYFADLPDDYRVKVIVKALPKAPSEVSLTLSPFRRHSQNPIFYHKTMNYTFNILVKRDARDRGYFDAVVLNERDQVTECSSSNLIVLKGSSLFTPARKSGLLWGTTLEELRLSLEIKEEYLKIDDLIRADALFVCNSIMGVVPVREFLGYEKPSKEIFKDVFSGLEND